ncbi:hypothetical protein IMCC26134_15105 [Verrucomicrobia bacterium IMCC26134]|jgi:hypothetical protein|nr:hypothetical protein IMCC26134_15105 [Verrucomicrobia bacterium IMCC26134]
MPADYNLLATLRQYLRRKYASNLTGLRAMADTTFASATETVTLTSLSAEGGSHSGEITCPKGLLLEAIESILLELDDTAPRASSCAAFTMR